MSDQQPNPHEIMPEDLVFLDKHDPTSAAAWREYAKAAEEEKKAIAENERLREEGASITKALADYLEQHGISISKADGMLEDMKPSIEGLAENATEEGAKLKQAFGEYIVDTIIEGANSRSQAFGESIAEIVKLGALAGEGLVTLGDALQKVHPIEATQARFEEMWGQYFGNPSPEQQHKITELLASHNKDALWEYWKQHIQEVMGADGIGGKASEALDKYLADMSDYFDRGDDDGQGEPVAA